MALRLARHCGEAERLALDATDRAILDGVEACLPWDLLLRSAGCHPAEVEGRVLRLLNTGFLEQALGEGTHDEQDAAGRADVLPLPSADDEAPPARAPRPTDIDSVLFELDPPSTLQSLLKRGPLSVDIHTRSPAERSGRVNQRSDVFPKVSIEQAEIDRLFNRKRTPRR